MSSYRFARRPGWIAMHLLVVAIAVLMVNLGFWQLRRYEGKVDHRDQVEANERIALAPLDEVLAPDATFDDAAPVAYRPVTATGRYRADEEFVVRSRMLDDQPGVWIAAPLELDDGTAIVVVRGFHPSGGEIDAVPPEVAAPTGPVTVTGYLQATQVRGLVGAVDPDEPGLTSFARLDVERIGRQVDRPLRPAFIMRTSSAPEETGPFPKPVPPPKPDLGPHLGYAYQWFIFTAILVGGYPLLLRRRAAKVDEAAGDEGSAEGHDPVAHDGDGAAHDAPATSGPLGTSGTSGTNDPGEVPAGH